MLHVPYKGSGPAIADLLAGHVQFFFSIPPTVMGYIKSGQLKAIGLAADEPSPLAPGGLDPILSGPAQFTAYLADERVRWTQVAKDIGFKHE